MSPAWWKQIEELYFRAAELDEEGRAALLAQLSPDVRQQVERLLRQPSGSRLMDWSRGGRPGEIDDLIDVLGGLPMEQSPLRNGSRLGPYEVLERIGAGGMGEVFRARDPRLRRDVAIKVSAAQFSARFDREARAIAALNHPNICQIYDVGPNYLVMELIEGPTLANRIKTGPIPLDEALPIAHQIASALEAAHEKNIVHRDLKPANIKIRSDGSVKVLDFGLAKEGTQEVTPDSTTLNPATETGMVVGTAAYMSPEQARGKAVDKRTDIWAFGVVLYEMLTGRRLFPGEDAGQTLALVITQEPDLSAVPPQALPLLKQCLAKDPKARLRDIGDAWLLLPNTTAGEIRPEPASTIRVSLAWSLAAMFAIATSILSFLHFRETPAAHVVMRFQYPLPEGQSFSRTERHAVAISPDGTRFAYVANQQLYLRGMDQLTAQPVQGTNEDPMEVVFSPDGQYLAYFAPAGSGNTSGILRKVAIAGGMPVTLSQLDGLPYGITWRDGVIAFGMNAGGTHGIQALPDTGGTPRTLLSVNPKEEAVAHPQLLADGKHVLFTSMSLANPTGTRNRIVVETIDEKDEKDGKPQRDRRILVNSGADPSLLPSGELVYIEAGTLMAVPFDVRRLSVTGSPVPLVEGVNQPPEDGLGQFSVSLNGTLVFMPGGSVSATDQRMLVWVDRQGHEEPIPAKPRSYVYPRLSPDGTKIAVNSRDEEKDLWVFDLATATLTRLTFGPAYEYHPVWTPDSRYLFFSSSQNDPPSPADLLRKAADGTGPTQRLTKPLEGGYPLSLTPDGRSLVFRRFAPTRGLFIVPLAPEGEPRPLIVDHGFTELNGEISPDGRWIAYDSDESGRREVYVRPFPAVENGRWQISSEGASDALWSRSGRELFFLTASKQMVAVSIPAGPRFSYSKPQSLFDATSYNQSSSRPFDISADGKRFLMVKNATNGNAVARPSVVVVSHWLDEVKARMPRKP